MRLVKSFGETISDQMTDGQVEDLISDGPVVERSNANGTGHPHLRSPEGCQHGYVVDSIHASPHSIV